MEQIFLQVLSRSLEASVVVLAVIAMRLVFRSAPKWMHCLMWALVAVKLACPFAIESEFSLMPTGHSLPRLLNEAGWETGGGGQISDSEDAVGQEKTGEFLVVTTEKIPPEEDGEGTQFSERPSADSERPNDNNAMARLPAAVWLTGAAALLLYGAGSYLRLKRRLADAVPVEGTTLPIYRSDRIQTAFLCGVVKPKIYLPFRLEEKGEETERQVIAHEAAHLQRGDHLTKVFAFVLAAVYWFNPVIWLAYVLYARDMELACDEKVIRGRSEEERKAYSRALLACAEENSAFLIHNAVPVRFGEIAVKKRIANVFNNKKRTVWMIVAVLIVMTVAAVTLLTQQGAFYKSALDQAVAEAIFEENDVPITEITIDGQVYRYGNAAKSLMLGECAGEGHRIFGTKKDENTLEVYVMYSLISYGVQEGQLTEASGSVRIPARMTFSIDENGQYILRDFEEAGDGDRYAAFMDERLPRGVANRMMLSEGLGWGLLNAELNRQCLRYGNNYLKVIDKTSIDKTP